MPVLRSNRDLTVAMVGATGAVGKELIQLLEARGFPVGELRLLASARSAGKYLPFRGGEVTVQELSRESLEGVDVAFFSASGAISREWGPVAVKLGAVVVDNSSAFRMTPGTPLIVPEVNGDELDAFNERGEPGIIANPNCSTIVMLMAVTPLRNAFGVERIVVSTYQAASGAGAEAMRELEDQTRDVLAGKEPQPRIFPEPYAFNLFSHNSAMDARTGRNLEEQKMIDETHKIWGDDSVRISPTCIRVPVMRAHSESVNIQLSTPATEAQVREALAAAPGVRIVDDRAANRFPTPREASGLDDVLVGRVRPDESLPFEGDRYHGFDLFLSGDQLLKGAALNAVQIAEGLLKSGSPGAAAIAASESHVRT